jgi:hypothetical protein
VGGFHGPPHDETPGVAVVSDLPDPSEALGVVDLDLLRRREPELLAVLGEAGFLDHVAGVHTLESFKASLGSAGDGGLRALMTTWFDDAFCEAPTACRELLGVLDELRDPEGTRTVEASLRYPGDPNPIFHDPIDAAFWRAWRAEDLAEAKGIEVAEAYRRVCAAETRGIAVNHPSLERSPEHAVVEVG